MGVPPEAPAVTSAQVSLLVAILAEVVATTALKASEGFTRP
jgi:multidrug transporter EmrE-like cation transporter